MNQETVLAKVSSYAPAEHIEQLRQTLSQAEHIFHNSPLPDDVTITRPTSVAHILAGWQVPVPLIETAVWSAALYRGNHSRFLSILDEDRARLASHLVSFMGLLTECRHRRDKCEVNLTVLSNFWREGFFVLVVAMFLDALRHSAHSYKTHDKKEMASQARTIFEPIASEHLGLRLVKCELRDLAFLCEDAQKYAEVKKRIDNQRQVLQPAIETIESMIKSEADECGISDLELKYEIAHPYMIQSSKQKGRLGLCDLISFVVLLPNEDVCYRFLRPLHMLGNAYDRKDYAVHPKPNGYRSLHSRIDIPPYGSVNFYIRTPDWDKESNFGVLNRWWNGEKRVFEKAADLIPHLKARIFVYTRYGDPYPLPHGATPVDLAYKMNEMTGHRYSRAYVFGKGFVESDYPMEDGDIVEIITGHHTEPNQAWLESVKTAEARKYIHQWEARQVAHNNGKGKAPKVPPLSKEDREISDAVVIPPEYEGTPCHRCIHCRPHPPQPVCAYVTHRGLTIHHISCSTIHDRMQTIPISWRASNVRSVSRVLTIEAWDHVGLLREVAEKIAACNTNIVELHAESRTDMTAQFAISLQEKNPEVVEKIRQALYEISAVNSVMVDRPKETAISAPYVSRTDAKILNPYTSQPVASPSIFFGRRDEILHIWRTLQSGGHQNSILFWGQQHIGKTSLLRHFETRTQEDSAPYYAPVYLTMLAWQQHQRASDLVFWFASQVQQSLAHISSKHHFHFSLPMFNHSHLRKNPAAALEEYIDQLQQAVSPLQLIVMIDEFQRLSQTPNQQGQVLISCLENLLETFRGVSFIFAGWGRRSRILHRLQNLTSVVPLGVLEPLSAENLIRLPVRPFIYEQGVVEKILELTHCHPYYIHLICGSIIDNAMDRPVTERVLTEKDFNMAADKLLSGNAGPFSQLLEATLYSDIVLDALARAPASADRYVELRMLLSQLKEKLSLDHVLNVLEALTELEVLEQSKEDSNAYRIHLPFFQHWLRRNPQYP